MATRRHFERPAAVDALGARGFVAALTVSQKTQSDGLLEGDWPEYTHIRYRVPLVRRELFAAARVPLGRTD